MAKRTRRRLSELSLSRIREILAEEQTILSRERTTHSYMQTGIAFIGVGLVIINVFSGTGYSILGGLLILIGLIEAVEAMRRLMSHKKIMKKVKQKEKKMSVFE